MYLKLPPYLRTNCEIGVQILKSPLDTIALQIEENRFQACNCMMKDFIAFLFLKMELRYVQFNYVIYVRILIL